MKTTLLLKTLRDMRSHLGSYIACAMVMAIGVMMYASMTQVVGSIPAAQQAFYQECRFGDAFATVNSMPSSKIARLAALKGIAQVSGRLVTTARIVDDSRSGNAQLRLISYDPKEAQRLNDILVTSGAAPAAGSYSVCLSENFLIANRLAPGDTIEVAVRGRRVPLTVLGSVQTPEYIYVMPEGSIMPDDLNYGIAYVPEDVFSSLLGREGEVNDLSFRLEEGATFEDVERAMNDELSPYGLITLLARKDQPSHAMLETEIQSMRAMVGVVPVIFLMLGSLIMTVVVKRMIEQQHEQIGLMKAYGYTNREVLGHYSLYGVAIGLMASLIGGLMGVLVAGYMADLMRTYFVMPGISGAFSPQNVLSLSALALVFAVGASLYGARGVMKLRAAEAMRPPAPPSGRPILLERLSFLWNALRSITQMSLRNLFRARSRSVMTLLGLTVCYALSAAVFAFSPMVDFMMNENFSMVQRYDVKVALSSITEARRLESTLNRMQEVDKVEPVLELPLTVRSGDRSKDTSVMAIPADSALFLMFDDKDRPVSLPGEGIVITYRLAKDLGVSIGDEVLLDIAWPDREIRAPVAALCEQYTTNYVVCENEFLARAMRVSPLATGAMIRTLGEREAAVAGLTQRLEEAENVSSILNVEQVKKSMNDLIQTSMSMLYAMAMMAVFAGFAIVYNASTVILSERTRELASMRILGFSLGETVRVVSYEQLVLCVAGILLGIPLAGYIMQALAQMVAEMADQFAIPARVPVSSHVTAALSILGAWLAAVGVTARKVRRMPMADVLKARE